MSAKLYRCTCTEGHVTHQSKLRLGCMVATAIQPETGEVIARCNAPVTYRELPSGPVRV